MVERMTIDTIAATAEKIWQAYASYKVWAFHAPMGSGKTTFIHALCEVLQVKAVVSSPTFAIINEYQSPIAGTIYHMDWYRLKDEEEAIQAGVEDALESGHLCLVEWPEQAAGLLPEVVLHVYLSTTDNLNEREISIP